MRAAQFIRPRDPPTVRHEALRNSRVAKRRGQFECFAGPARRLDKTKKLE